MSGNSVFWRESLGRSFAAHPFYLHRLIMNDNGVCSIVRRDSAGCQNCIVPVTDGRSRRTIDPTFNNPAIFVLHDMKELHIGQAQRLRFYK